MITFGHHHQQEEITARAIPFKVSGGASWCAVKENKGSAECSGLNPVQKDRQRPHLKVCAKIKSTDFDFDLWHEWEKQDPSYFCDDS